MVRNRSIRHAILMASLLSPALAFAEEADGNWPSFRGPRAAGVAEGGRLPAKWDAERGDGVAWKTPIPGLGHSSPVIWGDRLFVTTAVAEAGEAELKVGLYGDGWSADDNGVQSWKVYCVDKKSGDVVWERTAHRGEPKIKRHPKASHANSTPATDGESVVAFFGSEGLYCYDMEGELRWRKDLGVLHSGSFMMPVAQWGFASSPVLHDGKVIVQADVLKGSFLAVFDAADGREVWRTARDEFPTWSTPTVFESGGRTRIAVNGFKHMGAYDFSTGEPLWRLSGGGDVPVPTPIVGHGFVYLTNAHGAKRPVYAIRPDAEGDISLEDDATSSSGVAWSAPRGGAYMPTPILYGGELYVNRINGVLYCYDAKTGERRYETRLAVGEGFTASPVAGDGKLYFTSEAGDVYVVKPGTEYEELAVNPLGETAMATPAISEGTIFYRLRNHLVAITGKTARPEAAEAEGK